jgi:hypothetical protein
MHLLIYLFAFCLMMVTGLLIMAVFPQLGCAMLGGMLLVWAFGGD